MNKFSQLQKLELCCRVNAISLTMCIRTPSVIISNRKEMKVIRNLKRLMIIAIVMLAFAWRYLAVCYWIWGFLKLSYAATFRTSSSAVAQRRRCRVCQFWPKYRWQSFGYIDHWWLPNWMYSLLRRCLSVMRSFSVISANIVIGHTLVKLDSLGHIFIADITGLSSTT